MKPTATCMILSGVSSCGINFVCVSLLNLNKAIQSQVKTNWPRYTFNPLIFSLAGTLAQRYLGIFGFYAVSITGGLLSSASAVAAVGTVAAHNEVPVQIAVNGAVLASLASTLIHIPLVARVASQRSLTARLSFARGIIAGLGSAGVILHDSLKF